MRGVLSGPFARLPPLLTLERTLFRLIGVGFLLLTATIVSGGFFAEQVFGRALRFDHKTLFAVISWLIFAALLFGRYRYGWRGRTALRWVFAGFVALLLAYVGSRFVLEVILGRAANAETRRVENISLTVTTDRARRSADLSRRSSRSPRPA